MIKSVKIFDKYLNIIYTFLSEHRLFISITSTSISAMYRHMHFTFDPIYNEAHFAVAATNKIHEN